LRLWNWDIKVIFNQYFNHRAHKGWHKALKGKCKASILIRVLKLSVPFV
jgi:hypothetical protein